MLQRVKASHAAGPAARTRRLKDETRDVLAAHVLVAANGFDAFAAARAFEKEDVSKFSRDAYSLVGGGFHPIQNAGYCTIQPYPPAVISDTDVAGFLALKTQQSMWKEMRTGRAHRAAGSAFDLTVTCPGRVIALYAE
jgi:hypothetical protein